MYHAITSVLSAGQNSGQTTNSDKYNLLSLFSELILFLSVKELNPNEECLARVHETQNRVLGILPTRY